LHEGATTLIDAMAARAPLFGIQFARGFVPALMPRVNHGSSTHWRRRELCGQGIADCGHWVNPDAKRAFLPEHSLKQCRGDE